MALTRTLQLWARECLANDYWNWMPAFLCGIFIDLFKRPLRHNSVTCNLFLTNTNRNFRTHESLFIMGCFPIKAFYRDRKKKVLISWREPRLLWPVGWNWSNELQIISLCYSYTMCHCVVTREIILFRLKTASWISIKRLWVRCNCWLFKYVFFL